MNDAHHTTEGRKPWRTSRLSLMAAGALLSLSVAASPALGQDTTGGEGSAKQNVQQSTSEQGSSGQSSSEDGSSGEDSSGSGQQAEAKGADCELLQDFETSPMEDSYGDDLSKEIDRFHECVGGSQSGGGSGSGESGSSESGSSEGSGESGEASSGEAEQDNATDQYSQSGSSAGETGPDSGDGDSGDSSSDSSSGDSDSGDSSAESQYDDEGTTSGPNGDAEGSGDSSSDGPGNGSGEGSSESSSESGEQHDATATVSRAIDGDTVELEEPVEGHDTVRLIGVDSPETNSSEDGAEPEPYAEKASDFTAEELEGEEVSLEFGEDKEDDYDRLLAYVYTDHDEDGEASGSSGDGTSEGKEASTGTQDDPETFNETLLREGYGEVLTIEPNSEYEERFEEAEAAARDDGRGIWSEDDSGDASSSDSS